MPSKTLPRSEAEAVLPQSSQITSDVLPEYVRLVAKVSTPGELPGERIPKIVPAPPIVPEPIKVAPAATSTAPLASDPSTTSVPGWDDLNPRVWPSTYGTFERPDRLAPAVFE